MSDAENLATAMRDCAQVLMLFIGSDTDPEGPPIHEYDPAKRTGVRVRRDTLPEVQWRCAVMALDMLAIGIGFADPATPVSNEAFDDELRRLLGGKP